MRQWGGSEISDFSTAKNIPAISFSNNNTTEVSGKVFLSTSSDTKPFGGPGSLPDPARGAYSAPQTP